MAAFFKNLGKILGFLWFLVCTGIILSTMFQPGKTYIESACEKLRITFCLSEEKQLEAYKLWRQKSKEKLVTLVNSTPQLRGRLSSDLTPTQAEALLDIFQPRDWASREENQKPFFAWKASGRSFDELTALVRAKTSPGSSDLALNEPLFFKPEVEHAHDRKEILNKVFVTSESYRECERYGMSQECLRPYGL